jgi:hypothetical protein
VRHRGRHADGHLPRSPHASWTRQDTSASDDSDVFRRFGYSRYHVALLVAFIVPQGDIPSHFHLIQSMPFAEERPEGLGIRIAIDRGGTFTDCLGIVPGKQDILIKLLSNDPTNYADAPTEGIRRILEQATGETIPRGQKIDTRNIESIKMGTTVATNALLERSSTRCALVVTRGFRDLLRIGDQTRPKLFDLNIRRPETLFDDVLEIDERVTLHDSTEDKASLRDPNRNSFELKKGISGEAIRVLQPLGMLLIPLQAKQIDTDLE